MKKFLAIAMTMIAMNSYALADDTQVITKLKDSKITLLEGIKQAEKKSGPVISAKFEMDGEELSLSIYTAPQGFKTPAENNDLTELSGNPTAVPFSPKSEIFTDKEHIARASVHLTVMQMSKFSLSELIEKALDAQPGTAYSVANPMIRSGRPVVDIFIVDDHGHSVVVTLDVHTGHVIL